MGYIFELAADCDKEYRNAWEFGNAFEGLTWRLTDGTATSCTFKPSDIWQSNDQNWWCRVLPGGVSVTGAPRRVSTIPMLIEVLHLLYAHLSRCNNFRFARVGWEVEETLDAQVWLIARRDSSKLPAGVVISKELWMELGSPSTLLPFGIHSFWKPIQDSDYPKMVQLF